MAVESLSKHTGNATMQSPEGCLQDALKAINKEGAFKNGKKLIIIALDDTDGEYNISWFQAGMKMSECHNLCDVTKSLFLREMGYSMIPGDC